MALTEIELNVQTKDHTLIPSKISNNPADNFTFPNNVITSNTLFTNNISGLADVPVIIDVANRLLKDSTSVISVDWLNRLLKASDGSTSINFNTPGTIDIETILDLTGHSIIHVATPTSDSDAANKSYVDAVAQGLSIKASCLAATTVNLAVTAAGSQVGKTLTATANGLLTVDGVSTWVDITNNGGSPNPDGPNPASRVLVKDQTNPVNNGVYAVQDKGSAGTPYILIRAIDFDNSTTVTSGAFTFISEGTVNVSSGWILSTPNPIVVDTDPLNFTQFSGAGQIIAGNGLTKTGNQLDVNPQDASLEVHIGDINVRRDPAGAIGLSGAGIAVNVDGTYIGISANNIILLNPAQHTVAGTNGQVQFNNLGNFGASSNLFWDNINGRLGIGNSAPSVTLDVTGNGHFLSDVTVDTQVNVDLVKSRTGSLTLTPLTDSPSAIQLTDASGAPRVELNSLGATTFYVTTNPGIEATIRLLGNNALINGGEALSFQSTSGGDTKEWWLLANSTYNSIPSDNGFGLLDRNGGPWAWHVDGSYKFGINTNGQHANQLDVNGNVAIGSTYAGSLSAPTDGLIVQGSVGIGTSSPDASAVLDLTSITQGFLPPRLTTLQRDAIASPATGLFIYNTDTSGDQFYDGTQWVSISNGSISYGDDLFTAASTGTGQVFVLSNTPLANSLVVNHNGLVLRPTTDYTISGTTLTILENVSTGESIQAIYAIVVPSLSAVSSLNGLVGNVVLAAGTNITIVPTGNTLTINSTGGGGGTPAGVDGDVQFGETGAFAAAGESDPGFGYFRWDNGVKKLNLYTLDVNKEDTAGDVVFAVKSSGPSINGTNNYQIAQSPATTANNTPFVVHSQALDDDTAYLIEMRAVARDTSGTDKSAMFILHGCFKRFSGGNVVQVGTTDKLVNSDDPTWDADFTISGTNLSWVVTGDATDTVVWNITVIFQQVTV